MAQGKAAQIRLEEQIIELCSRVESLELRLAELESRPSPSEFELVSEAAFVASSLPSDSRPVPQPGSSAASAGIVDPDRVAALQHIGQWVRASLLGRRRGLSGRERISEGNHCYLVFRDFSGRLFDPVFFSLDFSEVAAIVKPAGVPGDSVFVGVPSIADAKIVCEQAGVQLIL